MKQLYIFIILIATSALSYGQLVNSLNFDRTNDRVDIGNVIQNASYTKEAMIKTNNIQS